MSRFNEWPPSAPFHPLNRDFTLNRDFLKRNFILVTRFCSLNRDFTLNRDSLNRDFTVNTFDIFNQSLCIKNCQNLFKKLRSIYKVIHSVQGAAEK